MIRKTAKPLPDPKRIALFGTVVILAAAAFAAGQARAQSLDAAELEELVAPIALYPDDVLGIILPASTFPLDVVRAARFLDDLEVDPSLEPDPAWDDSIVALLNYPEVLRMMNEDIDWTWALGEAVLTDEGAVLAAAQGFRGRALAAGNLRTDDRQIVTQSEEAIEIRPADPEVVYIPVYEPREVIVYHTRPYYYSYYPIGYPVYYYPYPVGYSFNVGFFWGVTSYFSIGWHSHHLHAYHHTHRLHPFYLNSYYAYEPYYYRRNVNITINVDNYSNVWRPSPRRGARQRTATIETRTSTARTQRTATVETQPNGVTRSTAPVTRSGTTPARTGSSSRSATTEVRGGGTNSTTRRVTADSASRTSGQPGQRQEAAIGGRVERSTDTATTRTRTVTAPQSSSSVRSGAAAPVRSGTTAPRSSVSAQSTTRRAEATPRSSSAPRTTIQSAPRTTTQPAPRQSAPRTTIQSAPRTTIQSAPRTTTRSAPRPQVQSGTRSQAPSGSVSRSSSNSAPRASGTTRSGGSPASSAGSTRRAGSGRP